MKVRWSQTGTKTEVLTVLVPDYFDLLQVASTDVQPSCNTMKQFTLETDPKMKIEEFKRIMLCLLENRPFFLAVNLPNDLTVANLLE